MTRVKEDWKQSNAQVFGLTAPTGMGFFTASTVGNALKMPTLLDAALGSYEAGFVTMEFAPAAALVGINFAVVSVGWEGGLGAAAMINQASLPGDPTVEEALIPITANNVNFFQELAK